MDSKASEGDSKKIDKSKVDKIIDQLLSVKTYINKLIYNFQ